MKFTIRDLLLVTVIVALVLGWWLDRKIQQAAKREEVEQLLEYLRAERKTEAELRKELSELRDKLPTSQAPAPNPPGSFSPPSSPE